MKKLPEETPVYLFMGFLESGKTKFIQETLEDKRFFSGEKTLLLVTEEGEEEYDPSKYADKNVTVRTAEKEDMTAENLAKWQLESDSDRIIVEYNGMWTLDTLFEAMPEGWFLTQTMAFFDTATFLSYNQNMRQLTFDKIKNAQMVVFNRLTPGQDTMPFHKLARAANRRIDILYDYTDGTTQFDDVVDPLPFDINAPVIQIKDEDFALWYRDVTEEPEKYAGKTVCFKAQVAMLRRQKEGLFAPGRFVMTCCVEDIQFCGIPCRYADAKSLESRSWVQVTAAISAEKHPLYKGDVGPVLTATEVVRNVPPADPDVATF